MTAPDDRTNRYLQQPAKSAINCAAMTWSEQTGSVYCRKRTRFVYESRQYSGPVLSDTRHTSFYADFAGCCIYDLLFYHPKNSLCCLHRCNGNIGSFDPGFSFHDILDLCPFGITDLGTADHYICAGITDTDDHIFKSLCRQ